MFPLALRYHKLVKGCKRMLTERGAVLRQLIDEHNLIERFANPNVFPHPSVEGLGADDVHQGLCLSQLLDELKFSPGHTMAEEAVGVHLLCLLSMAMDGEFHNAFQTLAEKNLTSSHALHRAPPKSFMRM